MLELPVYIDKHGVVARVVVIVVHPVDHPIGHLEPPGRAPRPQSTGNSAAALRPTHVTATRCRADFCRGRRCVRAGPPRATHGPLLRPKPSEAKLASGGERLRPVEAGPR